MLFIYGAFASAKTLYEAAAEDFRRKGSCKTRNKTVSVFFFKDDLHMFPDDTTQCQSQCNIVRNQEDADLILWHVPTQPKPPTKTSSNQIIGALGIEPYYNISQSRSLSDFTISYSYKNDIIYPYLEAFFYHDIMTAKPPTEEQFQKMKTAVVIISNCGVGERQEFVKNLMKLIPIDSKGSCLNNSPKISGHWTIISNVLRNQYKFYISIEKTNEEGYISEKFQNGFLVNSIPVYYGTNQSDQYVSPDSYIHVTSLSDPQSVAAQINGIANNYTKWVNVFNNRKKSFYRSKEVINWIEYVKHASGRRDRGNLCRICDFFCDKYE